MNNDTKRLIIFIIVSGVILFGFNFYYGKKFPKNEIQQAKSASQAETAPAELSKAASSPSPKPAPAAKPSSISKLKSRLYNVETDLVSASFSDIGGALAGYSIKAYTDGKEEKIPVQLIPNKASYSYYALKINGKDTSQSKWKYNGKEETAQQVSVSFKLVLKPGIEIIKTYVMNKTDYLVDIEISLMNSTGSPLVFKDIDMSWGPNIHFLPADTKKYKDGFDQFNKVVYLSGPKDVKKIRIKPDIKDTGTHSLDNSTPWIAIQSLYFISSMFLENKSLLKNMYYRTEPGGFIYTGLNINDIIVEPDKKETFKILSYVGPQEYKRLKELGMQKAVDIGWPRFLGIWMFYALDFIFKLVKNWGFAIILLTILIRAILWLPSNNSYKHMKDTQKKMNIIKPRMETLKKIYKDDPQKLNEETMKLYKEYKINPLGGCFPMLLQLPIFIALYRMLMNMVELKGAPFIWWMHDLSKPDQFYVLPLFMGISMFIQQKMSQTPSPTTEAASQQKIMLYAFPVMLTFFAFKWPSGLLLYWGVSNVLAIVQQFFVNKSKS